MKKLALIFIFSLSFSNAFATETVINLAEQNLFPEGITSDESGNLYVSSLKKGKIVKIDALTKQASDFVASNQDGLTSVVGLYADNKNHLLYACSSDTGVAEVPNKTKPALKVFDFKTAKLKASYDLPQGGANGSFCNDITIDNKNNVYVTDSFNSRILVLERKGKELKEFVSSDLFKAEGFGLNGIDFQDGYLLVNKYNDGKLFRINVRKKKIEEVALNRPISHADGLKFIAKDVLLVVEGSFSTNNSTAVGGTGGVSKIKLTIAKDKVSGDIQKLVEGLDVPATLTVTKNGIFVTESQYDHLYQYKTIPPYNFRIFGINLQ